MIYRSYLSFFCYFCNMYEITLNIAGRLRIWQRPLVMGIINVTPDSFYAGSRTAPGDVAARAVRMVSEGCDMLDIGGYSSRPGADTVSEAEECARLLPAVAAIREGVGDDVPVSVDTFRASVASKCIDAGADIINDISGGDLDPDMFSTVAALKVPYILMHTRGNPAEMQHLTDYEDVTAEVLRDLAFKIDRLRQEGVADIIADPGFGFAKTLDQNYELMDNLRVFRELRCPLLVGISRKSMLYKELGIQATDALNATTALNMAALMNGADILRVHDVKEAVETVRVYMALRRNMTSDERLITEQDNGGNVKCTLI